MQFVAFASPIFIGAAMKIGYDVICTSHSATSGRRRKSVIRRKPRAGRIKAAGQVPLSLEW